MKKPIKQRIADTLKVVAVILGLILFVDSVINSKSEMEDDDTELIESYKQDQYLMELEQSLNSNGEQNFSLTSQF